MPFPFKKFFALAFFSLFFLSLNGCANSSLAQLDAPSTQDVSVTTGYTPVVTVILPNGAGLCTGTFISTRAVLTAAHCALTNGTYTVLTTFGSFSTQNHQNLGPGTVDDANDLSILVFSSDVANRSAGQVYGIGSPVAALDRVQLVGFGCDNIDLKSGTGVKRTGSNQVYEVANYINLLTPITATDSSTASRGILGPANRAGSCFGDSGGPMLQRAGSSYGVVGVVHAGGQVASNLLSEYIDLNQSVNHNFIAQVDQTFQLHVFDWCGSAEGCGAQSASMQIISFLKLMWHKSFVKLMWHKLISIFF